MIKSVVSRCYSLFHSRSWLQLSLSVGLVCTFSSVNALSLPQLIELSVQDHPSVEVLQARTTAAAAVLDGAKQKFNPSFSLDAETVYNTSSTDAYAGDNHKITFSVTQPLWSAGRLEAGRDRAVARTQSIKAQTEQNRQSLALNVIQSYGNWLSAYKKRQAWAKSLKEHQKLRNQVKRRVRLGSSARSDLALADGRLAATRAELASTIVDEQISLTRLSQLARQKLSSIDLSVGQPQTKAIEVISTQQQLLDEAKKISPNVHLANAQLDLARIARREQEKVFQPTLSLRLESQYGNYSSKSSAIDTRIFLQLQSTFGPGYAQSAGIREAVAQQQAANANIALEQISVVEQVLIDYLIAQSFTERIKALKLSQATAIQVSASYKRQFLAGHKNWLDVLNSARDLVNSSIKLADAQTRNLVVTWRLAILTRGAEGYKRGII
ncbi:MAG: TolC family protein [Pseudomonadales bacterium]|nr:TolC family protein [Pseudomonadales bacterium]NRA15273.1 TolC family protein [Oceanospirillaceae bacterium]